VFVENAVLAQIPRCEKLCDKIDAVVPSVFPTFEALDDVRVFEVQALLNILNNCMQLPLRQMIVISCNLAPCDVNSNLAVKRLMASLELSSTNKFSIAVISSFWICFHHFMSIFFMVTLIFKVVLLRLRHLVVNCTVVVFLAVSDWDLNTQM
jgi:hypothetical protein